MSISIPHGMDSLTGFDLGLVELSIEKTILYLLL